MSCASEGPYQSCSASPSRAVWSGSIRARTARLFRQVCSASKHLAARFVSLAAGLIALQTSACSNDSPLAPGRTTAQLALHAHVIGLATDVSNYQVKIGAFYRRVSTDSVSLSVTPSSVSLESGQQITGTICNPMLPVSNKGAMFRPAPRGADHSLKEYYYVLLDVELHKYTTDPYISLATGNLCRTISTCFRESHQNKMYILCIDVLCE